MFLKLFSTMKWLICCVHLPHFGLGNLYPQDGNTRTIDYSNFLMDMTRVWLSHLDSEMKQGSL